MQPTPTCIIRARCCTPTPTPRRLRLLLLASLLECARGFVFPVAPGSSDVRSSLHVAATTSTHRFPALNLRRPGPEAVRLANAIIRLHRPLLFE